MEDILIKAGYISIHLFALTAVLEFADVMPILGWPWQGFVALGVCGVLYLLIERGLRPSTWAVGRSHDEHQP